VLSVFSSALQSCMETRLTLSRRLMSYLLLPSCLEFAIECHRFYCYVSICQNVLLTCTVHGKTCRSILMRVCAEMLTMQCLVHFDFFVFTRSMFYSMLFVVVFYANFRQFFTNFCNLHANLLVFVVTGPPAHSIGARLITLAGVCRCRL